MEEDFGDKNLNLCRKVLKIKAPLCEYKGLVGLEVGLRVKLTSQNVRAIDLSRCVD
jgi:hypothetical protein